MEWAFDILRGLIILFFILLPYLIIIIGMAFIEKDELWNIIKPFLLLILPWIVIIIGIVVGVDNFNINILDIEGMWFYLTPITWFCSGIVFYHAFN